MRRKRYSSMAAINITNLVDVMMVLLIVFMLTAPFLQAGVKLNLPKAEAKVIEERKGITVSVSKEGDLFIGKREVEWEEFAGALRKELETNAQRIFLRADTKTHYGKVMRVLARIKMMGIEDVGLIVKQENEE
ncbi:MAG TPA: biopolymer transporter ExbD [Candidatus Krumholzibacteriaceae bacterium]|nr:biopolymer transporter ExbD [Candidatus Krumholzibacteriaceae bacterium]